MPEKKVIQVIREIRKGELLNEFDEELHNLIGLCELIGKPGTITLTLKVKPSAGTGTAVVEDVLKMVPPKEPRLTLFHITPNNDLSLRDTRQGELKGLEKVTADKVVESIHKTKTVEKI